MDRVHLRNVFEVEAAGGGKGLNVLFKRQGGIKGIPKVENLWDWGKCVVINCY